MKEFADLISQAVSGRTHLFSVGQAGFIIKSASGQLLAIDLYLSDCAEQFYGHAGFKRLLPKILSPKELVFDAVIATHPHLDHYDADTVPQLMNNPRTHLFASTECAPLVQKARIPHSPGRVTYVVPGTDAVCGDFTLHFINCDHGTGAPDAVGVTVEVDGHLITEVGDTCLRLDRVPEITQYGAPDILIGPINGAYGNMNEHDFATLCDAVRPKLAIPCHYGLFAIHGGNPGIFMDDMNARGLPYLLMTQGEQLRL